MIDVKNVTREEIKNLLKVTACVVTFEKLDGTERKMRCTLAESFLPEKTTTESTKSEPATSLSVWDLDKQSWRAFRVDAIKSIDIC